MRFVGGGWARRLALLSLSGLLTICGEAVAQASGSFMDGNKLHSYFNDKYLEAAAAGYVTGLIDGVTSLAAGKMLTGSFFCVPSAATVQQVSDVVKKYLAEHPERRHYTASSVIFVALGEAFPCKEAQAK